MFQLKELVDSALEYGILDVSVYGELAHRTDIQGESEEAVLKYREAYWKKVMEPERQRRLISKLLNLIPKTQPFVYQDTVETVIYDEEIKGFEKPYVAPSIPFTVCSFEAADDKPIGTIRHPRRKGEEDDDVIYCLLINEVSPMKYESFHTQKHKMGGFRVSYQPPENMEKAALREKFVYERFVDRCLARLSTEKRMGNETLPYKLKAKKSRFHENSVYLPIKTIIHISDKRGAGGSSVGVSGQGVEWTHRWMVRGHWRKVGSIGKDRAGEYTVQGHTWVTEYIKGPENLSLVHKTRVVDKGRSDEQENEADKSE